MSLPEVLATRAPDWLPLAALTGEERFPKGAQLVRIAHGQATPLLAGFYATADADLSFDAHAVLFAARSAATAQWQIWELTLATGARRVVFAGTSDAILPHYLPNGQFAFALRTPAGFHIEVAGAPLDAPFASIPPGAASTLLDLTPMPGNFLPTAVLADGRILFESTYPLGAGSTPELYLVYSDGSGVEAYRCDHGQPRWGGRPLSNGDLLFTHGSSLGRFTSAAAHELPMAAATGSYASAPVRTASGQWLISFRRAQDAHFVLYTGSLVAPRIVLAQRDASLVQPLAMEPRMRPTRHPSALHPWSYANQLALDARIGRSGELAATPARVELQTLDAQGRIHSNGSAPVESDGSFFVQTPADRAIRFLLLDARGQILRQEQGWHWIRSGEQRICVGCHAGPEHSPDNRVPLALDHSTIPVDLTRQDANPAGRPAASPSGSFAHGVR